MRSNNLAKDAKREEGSRRIRESSSNISVHCYRCETMWILSFRGAESEVKATVASHIFTTAAWNIIFTREKDESGLHSKNMCIYLLIFIYLLLKIWLIVSLSCCVASCTTTWMPKGMHIYFCFCICWQPTYRDMLNALAGLSVWRRLAGARKPKHVI